MYLMKQFYLFTFLLLTLSASAQIPAGYYDSANGLSGFELKTQLKSIISNGHTPRTYSQLYDGDGISGSNGYVDTHSDVNVDGGTNYENDGSILDFYSENPTGPDPYNFTHGNEQCGNQSAEGDCYNREHIVPQSAFNSASPMVTDIHHVIPTDGRVNNYRGSYPFGNVANANLTSLNGSKRGSSAMPGYSGTVFEPIDEFKGDIARSLLYFATRYEDTVDGYTSFDMFNGTEDQVFFPWAITVLLDWHNNVDPVDQREVERNKAAYLFQGNANPFVDHPEYANLIWNPTPDTQAPTAPTNLVASNPTDNSITLSWDASTDDTGVTAYVIFQDGISSYTSTSTSYVVSGLTADTNYCFTVSATDAASNTSEISNESCETTTNNGTTTTDCLAETFENLSEDGSGYGERTWTGDDGGTWTATDARTDQTLNGKAITVRNGALTLPSTSGGIGTLTVTTQRVFSGTDGTFNVNVNGDFAGTISYTDTPQTVTLPNINIDGNVAITIDGNSLSTNRVVFDDLTYTCNSNLSVDTRNHINVNIYPNPVSSKLHIELGLDMDTEVTIFDMLGKRVYQNRITTSSLLDLQALNAGVYILRLTQNNATFSKQLIKN